MIRRRGALVCGLPDSSRGDPRGCDGQDRTPARADEGDVYVLPCKNIQSPLAASLWGIFLRSGPHDVRNKPSAKVSMRRDVDAIADFHPSNAPSYRNRALVPCHPTSAPYRSKSRATRSRRCRTVPDGRGGLRRGPLRREDVGWQRAALVGSIRADTPSTRSEPVRSGTRSMAVRPYERGCGQVGPGPTPGAASPAGSRGTSGRCRGWDRRDDVQGASLQAWREHCASGVW